MAEAKKETAKKTAKKTATKTAAKKAPAKKVAAKKAVKKTAEKKSSALAIIATGGKQYVVREGDTITIEKLPGEHTEGAKIEFKEVLLVDDGKAAKVGTPTVSGAKVSAEFVEEGRGKKISVIRFKAKSRYFKNRGHRQPFTRVRITSIA